MKRVTSFTICALLLLASATAGIAQENKDSTALAVLTVPSAGTLVKTDSLKTRKKSKHKKDKGDTGYNPYQPATPVAKPLPYNSYREKPAPVKELFNAGEAIRDIITTPKKHN